jgi:hypothetical protein
MANYERPRPALRRMDRAGHAEAAPSARYRPGAGWSARARCLDGCRAPQPTAVPGPVDILGCAFWQFSRPVHRRASPGRRDHTDRSSPRLSGTGGRPRIGDIPSPAAAVQTRPDRAGKPWRAAPALLAVAAPPADAAAPFWSLTRIQGTARGRARLRSLPREAELVAGTATARTGLPRPDDRSRAGRLARARPAAACSIILALTPVDGVRARRPRPRRLERSHAQGRPPWHQNPTA